MAYERIGGDDRARLRLRLRERETGRESEERTSRTPRLGPFDADSVSGSFSPLLLSPETLSKVRWDIVLDQGPRSATVFGLSTLGGAQSNAGFP